MIGSRADSRREGAEPPVVRKPRRWLKLLLAFLVLLILTLALLPTLVSRRGVALWAIDRFAPIAPLSIDLQSLQIGWFSPCAIDGVQVRDQDGQLLLSLERLEVPRTLTQLAFDSSQLGEVLVEGLMIRVEVQQGSTQIEKALEPLASKFAATPGDSSKPTKPLKGAVAIRNALIDIEDLVEPARWNIVIAEANVPFPSPAHPIPPVQLAASLHEFQPGLLPSDSLTEPPARSSGFTIRFEQLPGNPGEKSVGPFRLEAVTDQVPLEFLAVAKHRFPELPWETLTGNLSLRADVTVESAQNWLADLSSLQVDHLVVSAPQWLGPSGASLQQSRLSGKFTMSPERIVSQNIEFQSDFGQLGGFLSVPMPLTMPTATRPWLEGGTMNLRGEVDMSSLQRCAPGLVQMPEDARLIAGKATVSLVQESTSGAIPTAQLRARLGDLVAQLQGNTMKWEQAFSAELQLGPGPHQSPQLMLSCDSEFGRVEGKGDWIEGKLTANIDFDKLQQRLAKWFVLPITHLSGNAAAELNWLEQAAGRVQVSGSVKTSPLTVSMGQGDLQEPAWDGVVDCIVQLEGGMPTQLVEGRAQLTSLRDALRMSVDSPLALTASPSDAAAPAMASFTVQCDGDLSGWQKRALWLVPGDYPFQLGGKGSVAAKGMADLQALLIQEARVQMDDMSLVGDGFSYREPKMEGEFRGQFHSRQPTAFSIDRLDVKAHSFAIAAQDSPSPDGLSRQGIAAYRIDPARLATAINSADAVPSTLLSGDVTGNASWTASKEQLQWRVTTDAKGLQLVSNSPPNGSYVSTAASANPAQVLWTEPQALADLSGVFRYSDGSLLVDSSTLQLPWFAYQGQAKWLQPVDGSEAVVQGQFRYDAQRVIERLRPWIGDYLQMSGERVEPLEIQWKSTKSEGWADALAVQTKLGWDRAQAIGIDIGSADIPIVVERGVFRSSAEIPVSQGTVRWNLSSNLNDKMLRIQQAPQVVLEQVAITPQMCRGWLKYVTPLLADVTRVEGSLSLRLDEATIVPSDVMQQTFAGQIMIHGATVGSGPLADQLLLLVQQVKELRKGLSPSVAAEPEQWLQLAPQPIDFAVRQGRVAHRNLQIQAGDVTIVTSGDVGVDGSLNLIAQVPIRKEWLGNQAALQSLAGQSLSIPVGGTVQQPQLDMRGLSQMTVQLGQHAAQGYIQKQFDRGLNKLLGPMQQQLQQMQQSLPSNPFAPATTPAPAAPVPPGLPAGAPGIPGPTG
ncbi:MAG: hypothetical protein ACK44Z_05175 [Pirellulaceae bacterium]